VSDRLTAAVSATDWLGALRRFTLLATAGNLIWEVLQLPLYSLWYSADPGEIAYAVMHCTIGDMLLAVLSLAGALALVGTREWPARWFGRVGAMTILLGVVFTAYSEWVNVYVRESWAYSAWMPIVPGLGVGLSPLLQWFVVPAFAMWRLRVLLGRTQLWRGP
jgi:hypothetical protein